MTSIHQTIQRVAAMISGRKDLASPCDMPPRSHSWVESFGLDREVSVPTRPSKRRRAGLASSIGAIVALMFASSTASAYDETPPPLPQQTMIPGNTAGTTNQAPAQPAFVTPGFMAQNGSQPIYSIGAPEPDYYSMGSEPLYRERGLGYYFRAGHQGGKTVGTEDSLTFFEAMPYAFWEETMFLANGRVWVLNGGRMGGSIGSGFRRYLPQLDRTIGMIAWYDIDATHQEDFQEVVVTLESHGNRLDWDANIYLPFDVRKQDIGLAFNDGSQEFSGNSILFDQTRTSAFALTGFDTMWTTPVGIDFFEQFDTRIGAGFYHFVHGDIDDIWGWKGELEANVARYLDLSLMVSDDATFDTRVTVNASWTFDPNREVGERERAWDRMVLPPQRLWTIPKAEVDVVEADQVAINPVTGLPYSVIHVDSVTGVDVAGAGTLATPFDTVDNAINGVNAPGIDTWDIIFVRSGSTFDLEPTITVPEGKRILGGGDRIGHLVSYNEFGELRAPRARGDYNDGTFDPRPLYTNLGTPAGPGVTFAPIASLGGTVLSNAETEFSGFVVGNPDAADTTSGDSLTAFDPTTTVVPGQGPLGNGIEFVTLNTNTTITSQTSVRFVDLHGAQDNGLDFNGTDGTFQLQSLIVNQSGNHEMSVVGGAPVITFESTSASDRTILTDSQFTSRLDSFVVNRNNGSLLVPGQINPGGGNNGTLNGVAGDNHDLLISGTTGGSVNWIDVFTNSDTADGFLITGGSLSDVTIPVSTIINNSRGGGIHVAPGTGGNIVIAGTRTDLLTPGGGLTISNPSANAIQIGNPFDPVLNASPGLSTDAVVTFVQPLILNNLNQSTSGIMIANTTADTTFSTTATTDITYTLLTGGTASGFEFYQNFGGDLTLNNSTTITNAGGAGLRISNDPAVVITATNPVGVFNYAAGGGQAFLNIDNSAINTGLNGAALIIGADPPSGPPSNSLIGSAYESQVRFQAPMLIENLNSTAIYADQNFDRIDFDALVTVDAAGFTGASPVLILNQTGQVTFDDLEINDFIGQDVDFVNDNEPTAAELAAMFASLDMRNNIAPIVVNRLTIDSLGATGVFGYNNREIRISNADIETVGATAIEIFTPDSVIQAFINGTATTFTPTQLSLQVDDLNIVGAPDHGIHLANVKGSADINGGLFLGVGNNPGIQRDFLNGTAFEAGIYADNRLFRVIENIDPNDDDDLYTIGAFDLDVTTDSNGTTFQANTKGILALRIDSLDVQGSDTSRVFFFANSRESIDLLDIPEVSVDFSTFTTSWFSGIQTADGIITNPARNTVERSSIRHIMELALNTDNGDGPQEYNFVVGRRIPDFFFGQNEPTFRNEFTETNTGGSQYSVLLHNNAQENQIGQVDRGFATLQTGFIVHNNTFDKVDSGDDFRGFVHYFDAAGTSTANINAVMNDFFIADVANVQDDIVGAQFGAVGARHRSIAGEELVFKAYDNAILFRQSDSTGIYVETDGDGTASVFIGDTDDDSLTEDGDPLNDRLFADIAVATGSSGAAFRFDFGTEATVDIEDVEVLLLEDLLQNNNVGNLLNGTSVEQRGVVFESVLNDLSFTLNNTIFEFDDANLDNTYRTIEFNNVAGDVTLGGGGNFAVIVDAPAMPNTPPAPFLDIFQFLGAGVAQPFIVITDPTSLFDAPNSANFSGTIEINQVFVP